MSRESKNLEKVILEGRIIGFNMPRNLLKSLIIKFQPETSERPFEIYVFPENYRFRDEEKKRFEALIGKKVRIAVRLHETKKWDRYIGKILSFLGVEYPLPERYYSTFLRLIE